MDESNVPKLAKWPFFLGDAILLAFAGFVILKGVWPLSLPLVVTAGVAVLAGAWLAAHPYILEYRALIKMAETGELRSCLEQFKNLEQIGRQIGAATEQWQAVQRDAASTAQLTKSITDRMTIEAKAFAAFMQKADESEKGRLRLEIDKMRRGESEWLHVTVGILDHIFALYQAGVRSGQPGLIQQLSMFQDACRDVARRVGLVPHLPNLGDPFNANAHHLEDANATPPADAKVTLVLAPGFSFQGQFLRPALVRLDGAPPIPEEVSTPASQADGPEASPTMPSHPGQPSTEQQLF